MIKLGGVAAAAGILSRLKVDTADQVATDLKQRDEELAQQILDEILPFERLAQADSRSLQALVREAEAQMLMLALAGAAKDTRPEPACILSRKCPLRGPLGEVTSRERGNASHG
jgi:flagellar motor switch protein FliG